MTKLKITQFLSLLLLCLVTGTFWGTWFTLTRSLPDFSAAEFIHIGKTIIANVAWPMRILMPSCIILMELTLWFLPEKNSTVFYFSLAALVLIILALLITVLVEVPIDNQIKTWTPETIPANWKELRARWDAFHTLRTFISLASFASFSVALLRVRSLTEK